MGERIMIEIQNVSIIRDEKRVLSNFSGQIQLRQATLISGPNGAGKSSLVSAIAGVLAPASGGIRINNQDPYAVSAPDLARLRSVAPQRRSFVLAFTVDEVLNFVPKSLRASNAEPFIHALGLDELKQKKVTELSIGQQQRVSLGLALTQDAEFYLLDEPFDAQDAHYQAQIVELISELKKTKGVLVVSHNTDALHPYFDQEIVLS